MEQAWPAVTLVHASWLNQVEIFFPSSSAK
jgi:hypothetical protein